MRKLCLTTWMMIAAASGCAMPGFPGMPLQTAQKPQPQQQLVARSAPQPKPGFTETLKGMLPSMPGSSAKPQNQAAQSNSKTDPIALGYPSGPPTAALYLSMAQLSEQRGDAEHARAMYQKALAVEPSSIDSLLGLARLEDRADRFEAAVSVYQQAMNLHPQNAKVLNDLALCHARKGQFLPAAQLLDRATRIDPAKPLYRNNIAKVLIEMNRIDDAVSQLAVVHNPAVVQYNMGVMLQERGRTQEAVGFLTAATHIDSNLQPASLLLSQIQGTQPGQLEDDGILPTPMTAPATVANTGGYPSTGMTQQGPVPVSFPGSTAQVPVHNSPQNLPPVR